MAERRPLVEGLKSPAAPVDTGKEKDFVYGSKTAEKSGKPIDQATIEKPPSAMPPARVPLSTRMRGDFAEALKTASLQRQLKKVEPNTLTDILEEAVEPWLRKHGYLS